MANLLIGSSNINRYYKAGDFPNVRQYKMVKCTQMTGFTAYMDNLAKDSESVLISVVENFIVDAVGADVDDPKVAIDECIKNFLTVILGAALKHPRARFGVVMPLGRPALPWYQNNVDDITTFMGEGIKAMISDKNVNNVTAIDCVSAASQQFDPDQIHLTKPSAKIFFEVILDAAERFCKAPLVDLSDHAGFEDDGSGPSMEDRVSRLERQMRFQNDKNVASNLMFARVREEIDTISNKAKEDRLVINGLSSATPLPTDQRLRIEALKVIAADIFEKLIPGFEGKIVYLSQGKQQNQPLPMIEVKLDKKEHAIAIRKTFAEKKKKKSLSSNLDSLFIANSVNLATRIRIDIMKAVSKKLTNSAELAYVTGFTSKPMLHIRKAGRPSAILKPMRSYSYIDTVTRYGNMVGVEELETAYGRAGRSFNGQLQQNFIVLNEYDQGTLQPAFRDPGMKGPSSSGGSGGSGGSGSLGRTGSSHTPAAGDRRKGVKRPGDHITSANPKK
jgi:hypothetical protein